MSEELKLKAVGNAGLALHGNAMADAYRIALRILEGTQ